MNLPAAALAFYVVWLLAFPMDGFLATGEGDPYALLFFLVPHAVALLAWGFLLPRGRLGALSVGSAAVAAVLTAAFPWAPGGERYLLIAAGLGSSLLALRVGVLLHDTPSPRRSAAWGLVAGNLILAVLLLVPLATPAKALLLGGAAAFPAFLSLAPRSDAAPGRPAPSYSLRHYLPFLLAFHLVSGLFYGRLAPAYHAAAAVPAVELVFYAAAVLCSLYALRGSIDGALALGLPSSLLALLLFREASPVTLHLSMFAMQASAGFMDAFVLFLLLAQPNPLRAFGIGLGTLCLGIAGGKVLALSAGESAGTVTALGNASVNLALLSLYFSHRRRSQGLPALAAAPTVPLPPPDDLPKPSPYSVAPSLQARLSSMEKAVLERVLTGMKFREVAAELGISESSVKTYMKRLYDKAAVRGKAQLLAKLAGTPKALDPPKAATMGAVQD